jgi:Fe-S cluster assembly protein SufD
MTQVADRVHKKPLPAKLNPAPTWVQELRQAGEKAFGQLGYPTDQKLEAWRHTPLRPITEVEWKPSSPDEAGAKSIYANYTFGKDAVEVVLTNGHFSEALTQTKDLPAGLVVSSLASAYALDHADVVKKALGSLARLSQRGQQPAALAFVALNQAHLEGGVFIHVKRGAVIEKPIHIVCTTTATATDAITHPRIVVVIEDAAQCTLVQSFAGPNASRYFTNAVTEINVGADAIVDHYKLNQEGDTSYHVAAMNVVIGKKSQFIDHNATIGSRLTRNDITVKLNGEHSYSVLNGLTIIGGEQFVDNHTLLEHAYPNCPSYELYKHVLDGKAHAIFKGQIFVHDVAQKTDAKQSSKTLLLSDDAGINSQPALEIYADDVKCTHGSTTGPLDEGMLFYLQTRGLSAQQAKQVLIYAFAADVTRRIKVEPVRKRLESWMAAQQGLPSDFRIQELGGHDDDVVY